MTALATMRNSGRRLVQTVSVFDNGWTVLRDIGRRRDELVFRSGGTEIHVPNAPGARVPVYEVFAEDEYSLDWFLAGLGDSPVVLDVGAHIGCFSIDLATRFPGARIVSFEPTPSTGLFLDRNVRANDLQHRIDVHHAALAATSGVRVMADNGAGSGHNGVLHLGEDGATSIEVPAESLESAFAAAPGPVDVVKMDTEGGEYDIVLNTDATLWSGVRRLVMEYHPSTEHGLDDLRVHFAEAGLHLVRHDPGGPGIGLAWFARDELEPA